MVGAVGGFLAGLLLVLLLEDLQADRFEPATDRISAPAAVAAAGISLFAVWLVARTLAATQRTLDVTRKMALDQERIGDTQLRAWVYVGEATYDGERYLEVAFYHAVLTPAWDVKITTRTDWCQTGLPRTAMSDTLLASDLTHFRHRGNEEHSFRIMGQTERWVVKIDLHDFAVSTAQVLKHDFAVSTAQVLKVALSWTYRIHTGKTETGDTTLAAYYAEGNPAFEPLCTTELARSLDARGDQA